MWELGSGSVILWNLRLVVSAVQSACPNLWRFLSFDTGFTRLSSSDKTSGSCPFLVSLVVFWAVEPPLSPPADLGPSSLASLLRHGISGIEISGVPFILQISHVEVVGGHMECSIGVYKKCKILCNVFTVLLCDIFTVIGVYGFYCITNTFYGEYLFVRTCHSYADY